MYKRVSNIDEIIQDVKLTYDAWKTLFLLSEETSLDEIAATLQEDPEKIQTHLDSLQEAGLIETDSSEEVAVIPDEEPVLTEEAPVIEESVLEDEPEPVQEPEAVVFDETPAEEEMILEEAEPEDIAEVTEEPEPVVEEEAVADLLEEVEEPQTEAIEEEPPVVEESEEEAAEIASTNEAGEEPESLDLDFEETAKEKEEEPAPVEEIPQLEEQAPEAGGNNVILVIDDSIVIRKMVEIALENEDLVVETAVSGKDGMDKIDQLNPSLIILDLMLPDINGIDILKTVKASRKIPVIMLSGKDSPQMVENAKNAGADAFLPKPFKDDELKEQIKTLLEA